MPDDTICVSTEDLDVLTSWAYGQKSIPPSVADALFRIQIDLGTVEASSAVNEEQLVRRKLGGDHRY